MSIELLGEEEFMGVNDRDDDEGEGGSFGQDDFDVLLGQVEEAEQSVLDDELGRGKHRRKRSWQARLRAARRKRGRIRRKGGRARRRMSKKALKLRLALKIRKTQQRLKRMKMMLARLR